MMNFRCSAFNKNEVLNKSGKSPEKVLLTMKFILYILFVLKF